MMAPLFSILIQTNSKNRTQIHLKPEYFALRKIFIEHNSQFITCEFCCNRDGRRVSHSPYRRCTLNSLKYILKLDIQYSRQTTNAECQSQTANQISELKNKIKETHKATTPTQCIRGTKMVDKHNFSKTMLTPPVQCQ